MAEVKDPCISHSDSIDWTEVMPDSNYNNSFDSTISSKDETVITSNKVGRIIRATNQEEIVVDVDIERYSVPSKVNESVDKKYFPFDVIFEEIN